MFFTPTDGFLALLRAPLILASLSFWTLSNRPFCYFWENFSSQRQWPQTEVSEMISWSNFFLCSFLLLGTSNRKWRSQLSLVDRKYRPLPPHNGSHHRATPAAFSCPSKTFASLSPFSSLSFSFSFASILFAFSCPIQTMLAPDTSPSSGFPYALPTSK